MKKITYFFLLAAAIITLGACSSSGTTSGEGDESCVYLLHERSMNFKWTAYKFTEKTGVNGTFDNISLNTAEDAGSLDDLITSVSFTINTSTVNSKEPERDVKVDNFFFGTLKDTDEIVGAIRSVDGSKAVINLTINGLTTDIPGTIEINGDTIKLHSTVDFKEFGGEEAIDMLNKVCNEKHKGEDGESVFWDVVDINVQVVYSETCN
jgi:polyisoprenoid-binding protein YceI